MNQGNKGRKKILITGGTSGLGLELVRLFLKEGFEVVSTGRQENKITGYEGRFYFYNVDFSDLYQVAVTGKEIGKSHSFDFLINNAGILSPPAYRETVNGLEYTFQVNYLSHLLLNEIILDGVKDDHKIVIASVTSPVYRFASLEAGMILRSDAVNYNPVRSYSASKLYLAMMHEFLNMRYGELNLICFSFDPGTFSSGIYRMQKKWFRQMYMVAAPFMRNPSAVAMALAEILLGDDLVKCAVYDRRKHKDVLPYADPSMKAELMKSSYDLINKFIS